MKKMSLAKLLVCICWMSGLGLIESQKREEYSISSFFHQRISTWLHANNNPLGKFRSIFSIGSTEIDATESLTLEPTIEPTEEPTMSPTLEPTFNPTQEPSIEPTLLPSLLPTYTPSIFETATPTIGMLTPPPTFNESSLDLQLGTNYSVVIVANQLLAVSYDDYVEQTQSNNNAFCRTVENICQLKPKAVSVVHILAVTLNVSSLDGNSYDVQRFTRIAFNISIENVFHSTYKSSSSAFTSIYLMLLQALYSGDFDEEFRLNGGISSANNDTLGITSGFNATYSVIAMNSNSIENSNDDDDKAAPGNNTTDASSKSKSALDRQNWSPGAIAGLLLGSLLSLFVLYKIVQYVMTKYGGGLDTTLQYRIRTSGRYDGINDQETLIYSA